MGCLTLSPLTAHIWGVLQPYSSRSLLQIQETSPTGRGWPIASILGGTIEKLPDAMPNIGNTPLQTVVNAVGGHRSIREFVAHS